MGEQWKHVWGFSLYQVSDMGRVRHKHNGALLVPELAKDGHYYVKVTDSTRHMFMRRVCRLVMDAFDWQPDGYSQIYHDDGDKSNNRRSNLRRIMEFDPAAAKKKESLYVGMDDEGNDIRPALRASTRADREQSIKDDIARQPVKTGSHVTTPIEEHPHDYYRQAVEIRKKHYRAPVRVIETGKVYSSQAVLARALGLDPSTVNKMLRGKTRQKTYKGMTFEYSTEEPTVENQSKKNAFPNRPRARPIRVIQTGKVYSSQREISDDLGLNQSLISRMLRGLTTHTNGYSFEYVLEENEGE